MLDPRSLTPPLLYFGSVKVHTEGKQIRPPCGLLCMLCEVPFTQQDSGIILPWDTHDEGEASCGWHLACLRHSALGDE